MAESKPRPVGDTTSPKPSGKRLAPADHLFDFISRSVEPVLILDLASLDQQIADDSNAFFDSAMVRPPSNMPDDPCGPDQDDDLAAYCHQRVLDNTRAQNSYNSAVRGAAAPLQQEINNWELAVGQYNFALSGAKSTMSAAIKAARQTYDSKQNKDSGSRSANLYYELKEGVAAAVQAFNVTVATAGGVLAAEAGALLAAYATYVGGIEAAETQRQTDLATAQQNFWQGVEGVLDAS